MIHAQFRFLFPLLLCSTIFPQLALATRHDYPRLSFQTASPLKWHDVKDTLDIFVIHHEVVTPSPFEELADTYALLHTAGHSQWVDEIVRSFQVVMPYGCRTPLLEQDGKFPAWYYDRAKNNLSHLMAVAFHHNSAFHDVDWIMRDASGDTLFIWSHAYMFANLTQWCPPGMWDGTVSKAGRSWDFGSTVGLTALDWLCRVATDSLYVSNTDFRSVFAGLQFEDMFSRSLPCWAAFRENEQPITPDPKNDGLGIPCSQAYAESTRTSVDSLLVGFVGKIRDSGLHVRLNGHPYNSSWAIDTLACQTFQGGRMEGFRDWLGFPFSDSLQGHWFKCYEGIEDWMHATGVDSLDGWDISTIESNRSIAWTDERQRQWTRCSLGQSLMGNGYFAGSGTKLDQYFYRYLGEEHQTWQDRWPLFIDEMLFPLGQPCGDYGKHFPGGLTPNGWLAYRQFQESDPELKNPEKYTVVVNIWGEELGGVPPHDAMWYMGHHSTFPQPDSLLIFDHWSKTAAAATSSPRVPRSEGIVARGGNVIRLRLDVPGEVSVSIVDVQGRLVQTWSELELKAGDQTLTWDGTCVAGRRQPAGVYFWRATLHSGQQRGRMVLVH